MYNSIDNAVLVATWTVDDITYKLFEISRSAIDAGSDQPNPHDLIGIETITAVRRIDERFDGSYRRPHLRPGDDERVDRAIAHAPVDVTNIMYDYGWTRDE